MDSHPTPSHDPAGLLAALEADRRHARRATEPDPVLLFGVWGASWFLGFLALWTVTTGRQPDGVPGQAGGAAFAACLAVAMAVTVAHIVRRTTGVRGPSSVSGAMYGWAWPMSFVTLTVALQAAAAAGAGEAVLGLLWPVLSALVVGALYLAGGAMWQDRTTYALGVWILVAAGAGGLAGYPTVHLVMAVAGGGGFLATAAWVFVTARRSRAAAVPA